MRLRDPIGRHTGDKRSEVAKSESERQAEARCAKSEEATSGSEVAKTESE